MVACRAALADLAEASGLAPDRAAWGIHDIVNENMASAARVHIAECGRDPRDFTLLATGGAGPVHAYHVARKLGIRRLICPPAAGVASALGLLLAPARVDRVTAMTCRLDAADWPALEAAYQAMAADAAEVIAATGLDPESAVASREADMRFTGQAFEIVGPPPAPVAVADAVIATVIDGAALAARPPHLLAWRLERIECPPRLADPALLAWRPELEGRAVAVIRWRLEDGRPAALHRRLAKRQLAGYHLAQVSGREAWALQPLGPVQRQHQTAETPPLVFRRAVDRAFGPGGAEIAHGADARVSRVTAPDTLADLARLVAGLGLVEALSPRPQRRPAPASSSSSRTATPPARPPGRLSANATGPVTSPSPASSPPARTPMTISRPSDRPASATRSRRFSPRAPPKRARRRRAKRWLPPATT